MTTAISTGERGTKASVFNKYATPGDAANTDGRFGGRFDWGGNGYHEPV
jgi:hypothetical protein